jgi:hypothetical protein
VSLKVRLIALVAVCLAAVGSGVGYLVASRNHQKDVARHAPPVAQMSLAAVESQPRIVFVNKALGSSYGSVAMAPLSKPDGPRAISSTSCDRVYATAADVLCLSSDPGVVTTYAAHVLDNTFKATQKLPLTGIPSRARLSGDGKFAATTSFTSGDSYAGTSFSTRTVITPVAGKSLGSLENFTLIHNGESIKPVDRNYWGVTFAADDDTFFVTVEWSKHTWLARGSVAQHRLVTLHEDAECPSLSPDGKRIVFKQRGDLPPGKWQLVSYDVATGKVTLLAETHSVDDQVEWLDNNTVMYGISRTGSQAAVSDVWSVPADGTGQPKLLIAQAWSPAVVHGES